MFKKYYVLMILYTLTFMVIDNFGTRCNACRHCICQFMRICSLELVNKLRKLSSWFVWFLGKTAWEDWVQWSWRWRVNLRSPGTETSPPWPVLARPDPRHSDAVQYQRGHDPCLSGFHTGDDGVAVAADSGITLHSSGFVEHLELFKF